MISSARISSVTNKSVQSRQTVRQASGTLQQGKSMIVAGFAEPKKDHGYELIEKLEAGVQDML
ncbi:hypothetical protein F2Q70_00034057 [Brassica cretica]|uniref:Peptidyl-prolyl cis-trans isomerase CYP38-like PsbQ-like domain-containing protein n=1 Tax=Brassica cretica TaxID=69181 RepID=A0A8S9JW22_BRACR|nr:hypothetical protein F2Q70_00034057 [Brassica cretica]